MFIVDTRSFCRQVQYLVDRVWHKLSRWKEKLLSQVGKEIMIKTVIQALPDYTMQYFLLLKCICNKIICLIRNFWWGSSSEKSFVWWKSWRALCNSKKDGSLRASRALCNSKKDGSLRKSYVHKILWLLMFFELSTIKIQTFRS